MLNELLTIARSMDEAGITYGGGHAQVKKLGRGTAWRIRLGSNNAIASVDLIGEDVFTRLWTLRDGQHNSFPFMKLPPLFDISEVVSITEWKAMKSEEQRQYIMSFRGINEISANWSERCFSKGLLTSNLARRQNFLGSEAEFMTILIDRFAQSADVSEKFGRDIACEILEEVQASGAQDIINAAYGAFVGGFNFYFDLPFGDWLRDVGDPRTESVVSAALSDNAGGATGLCVLTGLEAVLHDGPFPQPKLPVLGQTYIFSKNADIPATARYGHAASGSFAVSQDIVSKLNGALQYLTREDARGLTWSNIAGEKPKQFDLLLSYVNAAGPYPIVSSLTPHKISTLETAIQKSEGSGEPEREVSPSTFEQRAKNLIEAFQAHDAVDLTKTRVGFCILRAVDPANRKVIYHNDISVKDLKTAVSGWIIGGKNLPDHLRLSVPSKQGDGRAWLFPRTIAPLEDITELSKAKFVNGGLRSTPVAGLSESDALTLFLERKSMMALRVLELLFARGEQLLVGIKAIERKNPSKLNNYNCWVALRFVSAFAIVLHIAGRPKETYMKDLAFKIGQFLNAVDLIHIGYCLDERNGQIPPTLLGNSFFRMAQTNPKEALGALALRWPPYDRWIKKPISKKTEEALSKKTDPTLPLDEAVEEKKRKSREEQRQLREAFYIKPRIRSLSIELYQALSQSFEPPNARFRAEMLLGYIAGIEWKLRDDASDEQNTTASTDIQDDGLAEVESS